jgi:signal transduction histidine kinase
VRHAVLGCWRCRWRAVALRLFHGCLGWLPCLFLTIAWVYCGVAVAQTAVHIEAAQMQVMPGGTFGSLPAQIQLNDDAWRQVALPHVQPRQIVAAQQDGNQILTAWYRIQVPTAVQAVDPHGLRLYLPRWQTIGQIAVYADERLVFRSAAGPVWNGFNHPLWLALDEPSNAKRPQTVLLRVDHLRSAGSAVSSVWLGDEAGLGSSRWWRQFVQVGLPYVLSVAYLLIGLFALTVWLRLGDTLYGLVFAAALIFFVRTLHFHQGLEPLPIPEVWFGWLTIYSLGWLTFAVYAIGLNLQVRRYKWVERILFSSLLFASVAAMPWFASTDSLSYWAPLIYFLMWGPSLLLIVLAAYAAWRSGIRDAQLIAGWNVTVIPMGMYDWALQNYYVNVEWVYLLPYHTTVIFFLFLYVAQRRYVGAQHQIERANAELETRLAEREAQLSATHMRLRTIENEQVLAQERQRMMQDMHDGLGSSLMVALKSVEGGGEQDLAQVLRECIDDLRLAIDSLEPVQADLLLLLATLRFRLGARLEQAGLHLVWDVQDVPPLPWLDPKSALHILRIAQEILGNAIKHGNANTVTLATRSVGQHVLLSIADNGQGFDAQHAKQNGRGLTHVTRRAQAIGATASWHSVADKVGTRFELLLPLNRAEETLPPSAV